LLLVRLSVSAVVALTACGDIPGFFYDVRLPRTPTSDDCMILAHAISAKLTDIKRTEVTSNGGNCGVYLGGGHVWVYVSSVRQENRLNLQIRPPSASQAADEIVAIAKVQFPEGEVVRVHPKQGLGP
jgi:hypothetical protein